MTWALESIMNNALASKRFFNPTNQRHYPRSDFYFQVATANTPGLGATREFAGREALDGAFLDRFRMGRIMVEFDVNLAHQVAHNAYNNPPVTTDPKAQRRAELLAELAALEA